MILCSFCNSEEFNSGIEKAHEGTSCIKGYIDLEKYVLNNETLMENLAETFFPTGKTASNFIKITYNFQTSDGRNTNKTSGTYIWSEAALYLLGPRSLFWCTLFAVNIREDNVIIELPCLCSDVYNSLLSRLTYLICIV